MVNMGIIGCGNISKTHAWCISQNPHARLAGLCDVLPGRAEALAAEYTCRAVTDYHDLLADDSIDGVSIALPHYLHAEVFEAALKSGKHCLCEKPLATTPADLHRMMSVAEQSSCLSGTLFQHRFTDKNRAVAAFIKSGGVGSLVRAELVFECLRTPEYYRSEVWRGSWRTEGGSLLINQAIHYIDLVSRFFGRPSTVQGTVGQEFIDGIETEDTAEALLSYQNGAEVKITALNRPGKLWNHKIVFTGSDGMLTIENDEIRMDSAERQRDIEALVHSTPDLVRADSIPGKSCYGNAHELAFTDFIAAIQDGRPPAVSISEGAVANEVVFAIYTSAARDELVQLPDYDYSVPALVRRTSPRVKRVISLR